MPKCFLCLCLFLISLNLQAQGVLPPDLPLPGAFLHSHYVDSVYHKLSRKKRIAQLFIVPAYSNRTHEFQDSMAALIKKYQPGGILFFQGSPKKQVLLENSYQHLLKIKALIAMDAEWGLGMRLDSTVSYPYQMTLGAIRDNALIQLMGSQVAQDFKRMGMQINFAPDIDINNNPDNSVINFRSFGENRDNVANKGMAYIRGMQGHGIIATAKHFPGHGDTNVDSHLDLPVLEFTRHRLDSLELYPFRRVIAGGAASVMIAHMHVTSIDSTKGIPTTLSHKAVSELLQGSLHFKGLVVTDAMNMLGLAKYYSPADAAVTALAAGNDMVEMSPDLPLAIKAVKKAIRKRKITPQELEQKCRKVLAYKKWAHLDQYNDVDTIKLIPNLNSIQSLMLVQQLSDSSLTLLRGLPKEIRLSLQTGKTAVLSLGTIKPSPIMDSLKKQFNLPSYYIAKNAVNQQIDSVKLLLKAYDRIVVCIHDHRVRPQSKLDFSQDLMNWITELAGSNNNILCFFSNAYSLAGIKGIENCHNLLLTYQDSPFAERSFFKFLKGAIPAGGSLPVTINPKLSYGEGLQNRKQK